MECTKQNWKIFIFQFVEKWKIFIFQRDVFRIQSDVTFVGLHGEGGKSYPSDRGPQTKILVHMINQNFLGENGFVWNTFAICDTPVSGAWLMHGATEPLPRALWQSFIELWVK